MQTERVTLNYGVGLSVMIFRYDFPIFPLCILDVWIVANEETVASAVCPNHYVDVKGS